MSILVTVIVPVYNAEDCIERCVNSIRQQTYDNLEIILVDDGAKDNSGAIIDRLASQDLRIKAYHKENGGSSSARNYGIAKATGDYFSFIDSDDYIEKDFIETMVSVVENCKSLGRDLPKIIQVGRDEIDTEGNRMADICTPPAVSETVSAIDFFRSLIMHIGDCSFCTKLVKRDMFDNLLFPEGKLNEDFRLLVQMLMTGCEVVSLPGYKYHVVYRLGSNSRKKDKNDFSRVFKDCVDNADLVEEIVKDRFPMLKKEARRFALFQRLEYLLHIPIVLMRPDYEGYSEIVAYVRKHWLSGIVSPYLTAKNKIYLSLFAIAPKGIRVVHAKIKHL